VEQVEGKVASAPQRRALTAPAVPWHLIRGLSARRELITVAGLGLAVSFGLLARLPHLLGADFPINDGGMFYAMVRDLQASHYVLPAHTSFNSYSIPFAYPPFPFYLAAAIDDLTPLSLTDVFRFLPLVANVLTIVVVYYLARRLLGSRTVAPELAAIIFALLPRGYRWLIMGGGLTRSLALLFALVALYQAYLVFRERKRSHLIAAIVFAALTVLSHPEVAYYLLFSFAVLLVCYGLRRQSLIDSAIMFAAVLVVTAPWWASALAREGFAPFHSASRTGGQSWDTWRAFFYWDFTELSMLNWPAVLAVLGAVICVSQGRFFLPAWLVVSVVLEPRSGPTYATIPIAMLSALAISRYVLPLAQRPVVHPTNGTGALHPTPNTGWPALAARWEPAVATIRSALPMASVGLLLFFFGFLSVREVLLPDPALTGLTRDDRAAFQWVHDKTPAGSTFAIVTGDYNPFTDKVSEWFPALTKGQSVATVQGFEWLGDDRYVHQWDNFDYLQGCQDVYCLDSWMASSRLTAKYVYVANDCCPDLELSLRSSRNYTLEYSGPAAAIFLRRGEALTTTSTSAGSGAPPGATPPPGG
jgi:hypothetical protein